MKFLIILSILWGIIFADIFNLKHWKKNQTFGTYLNSFGIDSTKIYAKINAEDLKFISSIEEGTLFFESVKDNKLQKLLIPLGEEMQIYLKKENNGSNNYSFDIIPINYKTIKDKVSIKIDKGCYIDLQNKINNPSLALYLKNIFSNYVDFGKLQKGDIINIEYTQKSINHTPWGKAIIKAALIKSKNKEFFAIKKQDGYKIFSNTDSIKSKVYTKKVIKNRYLSFRKPLSHLRVTSKFTYKRWHPLLHRYRPHLGVDFGAKKGTPIYSIADGRVIYAGWMRGYGKVVKISHRAKFVSLYAHQSKIFVKQGEKVKKGQKIGAIGSTGRSTGPHLHLGLYKNSHPVNPLKYINKKIKIGTFTKKIFINKKDYNLLLSNKDKKVYNSLKILSSSNPYKWKSLDKVININIKESQNVRRIKLSSSKGAIK